MNLCLKVVFPEYQMFVLLQNIEHFNSNSARNHNSSWQAKRKNFAQNFSFFPNFAPQREQWRGVKLVDIKNNEELMEMLGLKETFDKMAKVNGVLWYECVVRRDDDNFLKKALMLEVNGQRNRGRLKQIWRRQVEENVTKVRLEVNKAANSTRCKEEESDR